MKSNNKYFFILKIRAAIGWGLVSRIVPFSKSRRVLKLPPPTTLIGALSYPIVYYKKLPENIGLNLSSASIAKNLIVSVHASLKSLASIRGDVNRVYWYHLAKKITKTDAVSLEKIFVTPMKDFNYPILDVIYVIDPGIARETFGMLWDRFLEALAWSITRIGQKESMVSILNVKTKMVKPIVCDKVTIEYYVPYGTVKAIESGEFTLESFVPPTTDIGEYSGVEKIPYMIPYSFVKGKPTKVNIVVDGGKAFILDFNGEKVVFPREWVKT